MDNNRPIDLSWNDIFNSIWKKQTWLNVSYLLISFPLGLIYFIFLVTGISIGFGLLILVFGIFILMGVIMISYGLARFERVLAINFLNVDINPIEERNSKPGFLPKFRAMISNAFTWKGLFFLFLKFPLGVFSFSLTVSLLTASLALITAPIFYNANWYDFDIGPYIWNINTFEGSLLGFVIGILFLFFSLLLLNLLAWASGQLAKLLLGTRTF